MFPSCQSPCTSRTPGGRWRLTRPRRVPRPVCADQAVQDRTVEGVETLPGRVVVHLKNRREASGGPVTETAARSRWQPAQKPAKRPRLPRSPGRPRQPASRGNRESGDSHQPPPCAPHLTESGPRRRRAPEAARPRHARGRSRHRSETGHSGGAPGLRRRTSARRCDPRRSDKAGRSPGHRQPGPSAVSSTRNIAPQGGGRGVLQQLARSWSAIAAGSPVSLFACGRAPERPWPLGCRSRRAESGVVCGGGAAYRDRTHDPRITQGPASSLP